MKKDIGEGVVYGYETSTLKKLSVACDAIMQKCEALEDVIASLGDENDTIKLSCLIRDKLLPAMNELRPYVDQAETLTAKEYWPYPSYGDILFSVR